MIDRAKFLKLIVPVPMRTVSAVQAQGINFIIDEWDRRKLTDLRWLADILAQVYRETTSFQPIEEGSYLRPVSRVKAFQRALRYYPWFGRGYIQLTWQRNYVKFQKRVLALFGVDIVANPANALIPKVAAFILFEGMINGEFTSKKLGDYFNATKTDWVNARRIVNGLDHANEIAANAKAFYADLVQAAA